MKSQVLAAHNLPPKTVEVPDEAFHPRQVSLQNRYGGIARKFLLPPHVSYDTHERFLREARRRREPHRERLVVLRRHLAMQARDSAKDHHQRAQAVLEKRDLLFRVAARGHDALP